MHVYSPETVRNQQPAAREARNGGGKTKIDGARVSASVSRSGLHRGVREWEEPEGEGECEGVKGRLQLLGGGR